MYPFVFNPVYPSKGYTRLNKWNSPFLLGAVLEQCPNRYIAGPVDRTCPDR